MYIICTLYDKSHSLDLNLQIEKKSFNYVNFKQRYINLKFCQVNLTHAWIPVKKISEQIPIRVKLRIQIPLK